jgi:uncharacterized protein (TIGR01777 family)
MQQFVGYGDRDRTGVRGGSPRQTPLVSDGSDSVDKSFTLYAQPCSPLVALAAKRLMDVVVAGGTGFIGQPLCAALLRAGHTVTVLSRHPGSTRLSATVPVEVMSWDPARPHSDQAWVQRVGQADAVVNLAGENVGGRGPVPTRWTAGFKTALRTSRLQATDGIVRALSAAPARGPAALVNASAVGYYGSRRDEILTESSGPGSDFFGRLCVEWEAAAQAAANYGVRVVVVRTGVVLERQALAAHLLVLASKLGVGGPLGSGQQWWPWIHRDDVIGLVLHALDSETVSGALNAVSPNPRRMAEYPQVLGKLLHRPSVVPAPEFALRLLFGEVAEALLLSSQRALPRRALETGYAFQYATLEQALTAILRTTG